MKRLGITGGYTIVETLIFLTISGVLLTSAMLLFNGRQNRIEFTQGVREVEAQIKTIVNEAASGYYPNGGKFSCTSSGGNGPQVTATASIQGQNKGCIFLGRVIQFGSANQYIAYTVVGQRQGSNGRDVTSLGIGTNDAKQLLVMPSSLQPSMPNASVLYALPAGIVVKKIVLPDSNPPMSISAFGFITTFVANDATNNVVSGTTNLSLIPLTGTTLESTNPVEEAVSVTTNLSDNLRDTGKIVICLRSGSSSSDRQAAIIIGGNNNVGTEVVIDIVPAECS